MTGRQGKTIHSIKAVWVKLNGFLMMVEREEILSKITDLQVTYYYWFAFNNFSLSGGSPFFSIKKDALHMDSMETNHLILPSKFCARFYTRRGCLGVRTPKECRPRIIIAIKVVGELIQLQRIIKDESSWIEQRRQAYNAKVQNCLRKCRNYYYIKPKQAS